METGEHLKRYPNWRWRFEIAIKCEIRRPFEWGQCDCCLVAFRLVRAITGADLFPYRGKYSDLRGLHEIGRKDFDGALTTEDLARRLLGGSIDPGGARVGDMMFFERGAWNSLGTMTANGAMFRSLDGMIFMPPSRCKCAWKIG